MALQYNSNTVKALTYNGNDVKRLVYNGSVAWCKPFKLTVSTGAHVYSYTIMRTSHEEPIASDGRLFTGATIFYNDHLTVSATAETGYAMDSYTTAYDVSGNINISLTAHASKLTAPQIKIEWDHDDGEDSYYYVYYKNPNPEQCTLHFKRYQDGYWDSREYTDTLNGNSNWVYVTSIDVYGSYDSLGAYGWLSCNTKESSDTTYYYY